MKVKVTSDNSLVIVGVFSHFPKLNSVVGAETSVVLLSSPQTASVMTLQPPPALGAQLRSPPGPYRQSRKQVVSGAGLVSFTS